jgi:ubiquitin
MEWAGLLSTDKKTTTHFLERYRLNSLACRPFNRYLFFGMEWAGLLSTDKKTTTHFLERYRLNSLACRPFNRYLFVSIFFLSLKASYLDSKVSHRDQYLTSLYIISSVCYAPTNTDENNNMTGDATTVFCDAASNSEFINASAFPYLYGMQLPDSVTCDCKSFLSYNNVTIENSARTQYEPEQELFTRY